MEKGDNASSQRSFQVFADPNDASTWSIDDYTSDELMPIIGEVIVNGVTAIDTADKVAFFVGNVLKGYANIRHEGRLDKYVVSTLIEEHNLTDSLTIRYFDASSGNIRTAQNFLTFDKYGEGTFALPYPIVINEAPCPDILVLSGADSPSGGSTIFTAAQEIKVQGSFTIPAGATVELKAPIIRVEQQINAGLGAQVIISDEGCQN
jgi:hypothetical protein